MSDMLHFTVEGAKELRYRTRDTWSAERRVVAKAEWTGDKANPRFIVVSEGKTTYDAHGLYEDFYCARSKCLSDFDKRNQSATWKTASKNASSI